MANELVMAALKSAVGTATGLAMKDAYPHVKPVVVETATKVDVFVSSCATTPKERDWEARTNGNTTYSKLSAPIMYGGLAAGVATGCPAITYGAGVAAAAVEARSRCPQQ